MVIEIMGKFYSIINLDFSFLFFDAPINWQLGFQEPASMQMQAMINFHQDLVSYLVFLFIFVVTMFTCTIFMFMGSMAVLELL